MQHRSYAMGYSRYLSPQQGYRASQRNGVMGRYGFSCSTENVIPQEQISAVSAAQAHLGREKENGSARK